MKWHFDDPVACAALLAEHKTWRGTPFRKFGEAKGSGGGADCVGYVKCSLVNIKALPPILFPRRPRDYSASVYNARVLSFMRGQSDEPDAKTIASLLCEVSRFQPLMCGDLLLYRTGIELMQFCLMLDPPRFGYCYNNGVAEGDFGDPTFSKLLVTVFRIRAS
jgi:hypothetical protein